MAIPIPTVGPLSETVKRVIGSGVSFPFAFSSRGRSRQLSLERGIEKIHQSIHMILATRPGERIYLPEFGSKLPDLVFEPEDEILYDQLFLYTVEALNRWEKRISVDQIYILDSNKMFEAFSVEHTIGIQIEYSVRGSHVKGSYVFPFEFGAMPLADTVTREAI